MPLLIVVAVLLIGGVTWRARTSRRLTMEESVDNYRRTLSAVHDAAIRAPPDDGASPSRRLPARSAPRRTASRRPGSRRALVPTILAAATVIAVVVVVAASQGTSDHHGAAGATTTRPPVTRASTTTSTTRPAPTTTAPLLRATDASLTTFAISKPSYTLAVQTTTGACWIDVRDAAGKELFTGTLSAGASQSVTAGTATVRLGNPAAVTITVDGAAVPFSLASGSPLTLHFQNGAAP